MSKTSPIPPLLAPYLGLPPPSSLVLLTSVLGASTNWLLLRYIHSLLYPAGSVGDKGVGEEENGGEGEITVLFVSFLRDLGFWREGGRRIGLDFDKLHSSTPTTPHPKLHFVDGLSALHLPSNTPNTPNTKNPPIGTLLHDPSPQSISQILLKTIEDMNPQSQEKQQGTPKTVLIIDGLDYLLASSPPPTSQNSPLQQITSLLYTLRSHPAIHSTILSLSADLPLVSASSEIQHSSSSSWNSGTSSTPLQENSSAFVVGLAHEADWVIGVRELETGVARDVTGVVRVVAGGGGGGGDGRRDWGGDGEVEEKELLYFVGGDGGVRVFERGQ